MLNVRRVIRVIFYICLTMIIVPILNEFGVKYAEQTGWYNDMPDKLRAITEWLTGVSKTSQFRVVAAFLLGLTVGLWLEMLLRVNFFSRYSNLKNDRNVPKRLLQDFSDAARSNGKLGEPKSGVRSSKLTYIGGFQFAVVIWLNRNFSMYFIPQGRDERVTVNTDYNISDAAEFSDEAALRDRFGTPPHLYPPTGALAKLWMQNRPRWEWIGWCEWYYVLENGMSFFQEFKDGIIIGALPVNKNGTQAAIYIIMNSGECNLRSSEFIDLLPK